MEPEEKNPKNFTQTFIEKDEDRRKRLLERIRQQKTDRERNYISPINYPIRRTVLGKIEDREEKREKELKNDALEQDIELKKTTLNRLFRFLSLETTVIFILAFLQGFKLHEFYLEEWSFRLLVAVTITQITIMLQFAVKHLFPQSSKK